MRTRCGSTALALLAVLSAAVLSGRIPWLRQAPQPRIERLEPGRWYALEISQEEAEFDLPFDARGSRHVLIVSNLSAGGPAQEIVLSAAPVAAASPIAARAVDPLDALRPIEEALARRSGIDEGCSSGGGGSSGSARPTADSAARTFSLHVTEGPLDDPRQYARIAAQPIAEGRSVRVYLDDCLRPRDLFPGLAEEIVRLVDEEVVPRSRRVLGTHRDVDGDGKFAVLLTPWLDRLQGGRTSLGGMVRGDDFRTDRQPPFGNRSDLMFLNSTARPDRHLRTLLIHEYAHAVCFSARLGSDAAPVPLPAEEDWLNEAIAHVSEHLHEGGWSNLDYRISRFLDDTAEYPLVVPDYYGAGLWRSHGCRGATFLFLRWCCDRFGDEVLGRLARGPGTGARNIERATGVPFEELYRRWTIAVYGAGRESAEADPSASTDGYRSLDLRAPLSGWGLAGPRALEWDVDGGNWSVDVGGTASAFVELRASGGVGPRRVRVRAARGTRLQLSLRAIPDAAPEAQIAAEWRDAGTGASGEEGGETLRDSRTPPRSLAVRLTCDAAEAGGGAPELEFVACEINAGETHRTRCLEGIELVRAIGKIDGRRTARRGESGLATERPRSTWRIELPVPFPLAPDDVLIVKAVVRDAAGRRSAARTEIRSPGARPPLELAARHAPGSAR
ncbi:MAG: hypothetical protein WD069_01425 [Planctomycetales bacterium]